jgi:hypothetical protein
MKHLIFLRNTFAILFAASLLLLSACNNDDDEPTIETTTYNLNQVGGSGVSGTAVFERLSETVTRITVQVSGTTDGDTHPMHIHHNSVAEGGGIAVTLTPVNGASGMSVTEVTQMDNGTAINYGQLLAFNGFINIHLSPTQMATIISQGDIGSNAP